MVTTLTACENKSNAETFTGKADGIKGEITVEVTKEGDKITKLHLIMMKTMMQQ